MPYAADISFFCPNLFGTPEAHARFSGASDPEGLRDHDLLARIAQKITRTRRPGAVSAIPAGATYLGQFVSLDLDAAEHGRGQLDLGVVYGDGPKQSSLCYQLPTRPGVGRHLLRVGAARMRDTAPAWGPLRDLPRTNCPHVDPRMAEGRPDVLVPNGLSDSNVLLAQVHVLWSLLHNAIAATLVEADGPDVAFGHARALTQEVYRAVVRNDLLGTWLMPSFRARYVTERPQRLDPVVRRVPPREFTLGVGRLGHGLVREVYALNDRHEAVGLRDILRHTCAGRPHEMPLTWDWLVDFSRFFAIGSSVPQRARALGPHVARPLATGVGLGTARSDGGLVLRDLLACARGGVRSVSSLVTEATRREPRLFEGCLVQDETERTALVARWLADVGLAADDVARLAADPPLVLYLMLEAEAETGGQTLGPLGSVILGETIAGAMPVEQDSPELAAVRSAVFRGRTPQSMASLIPFLQQHYQFPDGARLHGGAEIAPFRTTIPNSGGKAMLDIRQVVREPLPHIHVVDYIEMGRIVSQWAIDPSTRPATIEDLRRQLDGVAVVPPTVRSFSFAQGTTDHVVLRLPTKESIEEGIDRMNDPMANGRYPLPQFYVDHFRPGFGPVMTLPDTLMARVGDQVIAEG